MARKPFTAIIERKYGCSNKTNMELRIEINKILLKYDAKNLTKKPSP